MHQLRLDEPVGGARTGARAYAQAQHIVCVWVLPTLPLKKMGAEDQRAHHQGAQRGQQHGPSGHVLGPPR